MTIQPVIRKAGAVLLDGHGNFLVTRTAGKNIFVAPGGKLEAGESAKEALVREMLEEVQVEIDAETVERIGSFKATAAGDETKIVEMEVFIIKNYVGQPIPSSEIEEIMWVNSQTKGVSIGSIFAHEVMPILKARGLIN
jgi:8-oxo-dGTP diphosphatase